MSFLVIVPIVTVFLYLGNELAPKVHWKGCCSSYKYAQKIILPFLDFFSLQCCAGGNRVGKVDRSSLTLELRLCRPLINQNLVLYALGEFHIVSFVGVCVCAQ